MDNIIVIGGGLMGSAATWQLSSKGYPVTLIEQQVPVYSHGSSFGEARISRSLGPENDIFSWLQQITVREAKKLIQYLNTAEGHQAHRMEDIYSTSPVTYLYYKTQEKEIQSLLRHQADPYTLAHTPDEARKLLGLEISPDLTVIREHKKYSGTLNPQELIKKLHLGITLSGGKIIYNHSVDYLTLTDGIYSLECTDRTTGQTVTLRSHKIVSAAGPYTGTLLRTIAPEFQKIILPQRTFLTFFTITSTAWDRITSAMKKKMAESYPVAWMDAHIFYSMIENYSSGIPVIKVGGHLRRTHIDSLDEGWTLKAPPSEVDWAKKSTLEYLEMLGISLACEDLYLKDSYACVYSMTHSEVPFVTPLEHEKGLKQKSMVVIAGLSGVGAKGALAYGLLASDYLAGSTEGTRMYLKTAEALGPERISRFKQGVTISPIKKFTL